MFKRTMKHHLICGLMIFLIGVMPASTAGASPNAQNAGEWRNYPTDAPVTALAASGDTLWVGTTNGLIRFNRIDSSSVIYTTADGLPDNRINVIAVAADGRVWFVTQGKLTIFTPPGPICNEAAPENVRHSE